MDELEPRQSVDFEPVVVPNRRRRRFDPLVIGPLLVAFGVLIGVAWPDDSVPSQSTAAPSTNPGPATPAEASLDPQGLGIVPAGIAEAESMAFTQRILGGWGVRTYELVDGEIERRWQPVTPGEGPIAPLIVVDSATIGIVEITTPLGETPLDVRVWARGYVGQWDWIDTGASAVRALDGRIILRPPRVDGRWLPAWPAGRYRFDLLLGERIARIDLTVDRDAPVLDAPISSWVTPTVSPAREWGPGLQAGPFVVSSGIAVPVRAGPSGDLGIAEAWTAGDADIARAWLPSATSLGVLLPAGARDAVGTLRRLVPEEVYRPPPAIVGALGRGGDVPDTFVRFDARRGSRFEPSIYAIDAAWTTSDGEATATWVIELQPAPGMTTSLPLLLEAARLAGNVPGGDAMVVDATPGLVPTHRWIEPIPTGAPCDQSIASIPVAILLAEAPDAPIDAVRLEGPGFPHLRLARIPGWVIAVPALGVGFGPGERAMVVDGAASRIVTFCSPGSPFGG